MLKMSKRRARKLAYIASAIAGEVDMSRWPRSRDERLCEHGVGHPEPGKPHHGGGIHGCDGCCRPLEVNSAK